MSVITPTVDTSRSVADVRTTWDPAARAEAIEKLWRVVDEAHAQCTSRKNSRHTSDPTTCPICKQSAEMLGGEG